MAARKSPRFVRVSEINSYAALATGKSATESTAIAVAINDCLRHSRRVTAQMTEKTIYQPIPPPILEDRKRERRWTPNVLKMSKND